MKASVNSRRVSLLGAVVIVAALPAAAQDFPGRTGGGMHSAAPTMGPGGGGSMPGSPGGPSFGGAPSGPAPGGGPGGVSGNHAAPGGPNFSGRGAPGPHYSFRGRDFARFSPRESEIWRGGAWRHDWYHGRYGWWWVVDGGWYFYSEPVYPYPGYVSGDVYEDEGPAPYAPTPYPAAPYAAGQFWYYCDYPQGYYPYIANCAYPWRTVPARPY